MSLTELDPDRARGRTAPSGRPTAGPSCAVDGQVARARHAAWLQQAAAGDEAAFMAFFDATVGVIHALVRCRHPSHRAAGVTRDTYVAAWLRAGEQVESGLSPLAWLATLVPRAGDPRPTGGRCAA